MRETTANAIIKTGPIRPESDTYCVVNVRVTHPVQRRGSTAGRSLARWEISRAFITRFHTKYQITDGCWLWQAGKFPGGYGMVNLGRDVRGKQRTDYAHRVAYVLATGPIPAGLVVRHSCDTPACVNPAHLSLGTQGDNIHDAVVQGHYNAPHPRSQKITDAQVREIRASVESSVSLARRFGVTLTCISQIRHGHRRKVA